MSNRSFEMYQYRQIIVRLRSGESMRSIGRSKLADRKTVRRVRNIAMQQRWLSRETEIPSDEVLAKFLGQPRAPSKGLLVLPHQQQIEHWCRQNIQASTIYLTLQRQHGFTGSYHSVQRFIKNIKNKSIDVTMILDFKPGECAQVDFGLDQN